MPLYVLTVFLGAFLVFAVQPMMAKAILPWFGGSASVWTTCLLFFQVVLLLGYLYAHGLIRRLGPRAQASLHVAMLGASLLLLPVTPGVGWKPSGGEDPAGRILALLLGSVGLPYFLLSATGPLVQAWCARSVAGVAPYRLYAVSNAGAMAALLSYPAAVEPLVSLPRQLASWSLLYGLFAVLFAAVALRSRAAATASEPPGPESAAPRPPMKLQLQWVALAACASTLLLAVTNHLCQNVAPIPFLWVLPLSLYLLSFILCFDHPRWYQPKLFYVLLALALGAMNYMLVKSIGGFRLIILVFSAGLFVGCMFCHGELVRRKPEARYLTSFYLMVSLGGALGGMLVGFAAPRLFRGYYELPVAIAACGILALFLIYRLHWASDLAAAAVAVLVTAASAAQILATGANTRLMARNFYGGLRIVDSPGSSDRVRTMVHGVINHGMQFLAPERRLHPTAYYGPASGAALAIRQLRRSSLRVGLIGLGAGVLAVYGRPGDTYRFYEINPLVVKLAREEFTFLRESQARVELVVGDARLSLEREPDQQFDVLVIDAFSGDSIPVHLLSREAFQLYFRHVKAGGAIALHISNTYLDLAPVVRAAAGALGKQTAQVLTLEDPANRISASQWMVMSDSREFFLKSGLRPDAAAGARRIRLWTDDYSNQFQILR